jgi:hypothetical protein
VRSEHAVATIGWEGWGAVCQVREFEGGESVARGRRTCVGDPPGGGGIFNRAFSGDSRVGSMIVAAANEGIGWDVFTNFMSNTINVESSGEQGQPLSVREMGGRSCTRGTKSSR